MQIMKNIIRKGLVLMLVLISLGAGGGSVMASELEDFKPAVVMTENLDPVEVSPGASVTLTIPVKALNTYLQNPYVTIDSKDFPRPPEISVKSKFRLFKENYQGDTIGIGNSDTTYIQFDVQVSDTAAAGTYSIYLTFKYVEGVTTKTLTMDVPIQIMVKQAKASPIMSVSELEVDRNNLLPGDSFNITGVMKNVGELAAKNVEIAIEGFETEGILPDFSSQKKTIGTVANGTIIQLDYPAHVSETATAGMKTITIKVTYVNEKKETLTETSSVYVEVNKKKEEKKGEANLIIKDVKQSPSVPKAGGPLNITYTVQNKGKADAREVKISLTGLTNTNFSPVKAEPYMYLKTLKAGTSKKISVNFKVSNKVPEGLNEIGLDITYKDKDGKDITSGGNKIYISNVSNPEKTKTSAGVPKLIISKFETGKDPLKAGKKFVFSFDIYNTHSSLSANNIKVTLSSEKNEFSVTNGSNSFYIPSIQSGETVHKEVGLKVKADCITDSYPLKVDFEYEYEGMQKLENEISTGLKVSESLLLQVLENSRPTVSNIVVGTWEPAAANTPCNMSFDFYNMGKSILYNVTAKIESKDFVPTQQIKFIGNVEAGAGATQELEVTPTVENADGKGTLIITYEDSNGTAYEVPTEFTQFVSAQQTGNMGDMGGMMPPVEDVGKKPILNMWFFIGIQVVLFFASIIIIRKIVIKIYKAKMHKEEE